jgi:CheY-like chemotaxis protein
MTGSGVPKRPRILVAEDDPGLLETLAALLADSGYEVLAALSGKQAIALLKEAHADVVLTDIVMPDATGVDVLRAAREQHLDTPVILMTGNPSVPTAVEALSLGALNYLVKPVSEATLLSAVSEALSLSRLALVRRQAVAELGGGKFIGDRAALDAVFARAQAGLWVAYQPVIWAKTGAPFGCEALLRTTAPEVPTADAFLEVAERLDVIPELGRRVRRRIVDDLPGLSEAVLVNVHPLELRDPDLGGDTDPLSAFADRVVLEITERASLDGRRPSRDESPPAREGVPGRGRRPRIRLRLLVELRVARAGHGEDRHVPDTRSRSPPDQAQAGGLDHRALPRSRHPRRRGRHRDGGRAGRRPGDRLRSPPGLSSRPSRRPPSANRHGWSPGGEVKGGGR